METLQKPVVVVWAALVLATVASTWWLSKDGISPTVATVAIVLIGSFKIRLVMRHFMELKNAPVKLQLVNDAWLLAVTGVILGLYLF
ncbi:MAG TPA: cytochrome C oxidase subunit IV family protein [Pseudonocardia sp.]|jgi:heme/copper-type cytochrome/quinol oxidase subunit 4|nr:cytochrome C oxidase subunit IV family protein [Pseudonocardia sp.]